MQVLYERCALGFPLPNYTAGTLHLVLQLQCFFPLPSTAGTLRLVLSQWREHTWQKLSNSGSNKVSESRRNARLPVPYDQYHLVETELKYLKVAMQSLEQDLNNFRKGLDEPIRELKKMASSEGGKKGRAVQVIERFFRSYDVPGVLMAFFCKVLMLEEDRVRGSGMEYEGMSNCESVFRFL